MRVCHLSSRLCVAGIYPSCNYKASFSNYLGSGNPVPYTPKFKDFWALPSHYIKMSPDMSVFIAGVGVISAIGNNTAECLLSFENGKAGMDEMKYLPPAHRKQR